MKIQMIFIVHPGPKRLLQMEMPKMDIMPILRVGPTVIQNLMVIMKTHYLVLAKNENERNVLPMMKITE